VTQHRTTAKKSRYLAVFEQISDAQSRFVYETHCLKREMKKLSFLSFKEKERKAEATKQEEKECASF